MRDRKECTSEEKQNNHNNIVNKNNNNKKQYGGPRINPPKCCQNADRESTPEIGSENASAKKTEKPYFILCGPMFVV